MVCLLFLFVSLDGYIGVARAEFFLRTPKNNLETLCLETLPKSGLLLKERICSLWGAASKIGATLKGKNFSQGANSFL